MQDIYSPASEFSSQALLALTDARKAVEAGTARTVSSASTCAHLCSLSCAG